MWQRKNKYHNQRTEVYGLVFSSKKEADRYVELMCARQSGLIRNLTLQPKFELQEAFTDSQGEKHRAITYIADFSYEEKQSDGNWKIVVEDVKGGSATKTEVYRIKKKLFLKKYKLPLIEI